MNHSEDLTLPDWQCEKCNLYSPQTSSALYLWCTKCEKIFCALCIGKCNSESHSWIPASEIIYQLKSDIVYTNADMVKSVTNMKISGKDTLRSLHGLTRTLTELKKQCEGVTDVITVLSDALIERQNAADLRRTETDEHLPFTSILVRKLRAEIEANKNLAQEASAMIVTFNEVVKQSDNICKDARILMNSFLVEKKLGAEIKDEAKIELADDAVSQKSNVNAFGDMLDDSEYDLTIREAAHHVAKQDDRMEDSGKTGILDDTAAPELAETATKKTTTSTDRI